MATQVVDHTLIVDTRLRQDQPTTNFGTGVDMTITGEDFTGNKHVAILALDLTARDPTDTCDDATLRLVTNNAATAGFTFEVHEILAANHGWTETGATWNTRDGTNAWAGGASGCFVSGTDYSATNLATDTYTANDPAGTELLFVLTPSVVESYFGSTMHLLVTKQGNGSNTAPALCSTENSTTANRPSLTINYTVAVSNAITPANPTVQAYSPIVAHIRASYTVDSGDESGSVATFAYSTNGTDWTATQAADVVSYDRTNNYAEILIGNLTPGTAYYFRVTWSGVTITGSNPRYIGSSTTPGTSTTMLTYPGDRDALVSGTPQYAGARVSYHWTEHNLVVGASNLADDDYATIAKFDVLNLNIPSTTARRDYVAALRAEGTVENVFRYTLAAEIRVDGSGNGITFSSTWLFDDTARDAFNAQKDETWFLHSASPGTLANRLTRVEDSATKHLLNLANAEVLAFLYEQDKRIEVAYHGSGLATADHRSQHRVLDNYFVELDRLELPVADSPFEYANAAAMHAAFNDLTLALQQSGARVSANVLVNNDTVQSEVEAVGASLNTWWFETWWTSFAGSTPAYRTDAQWKICCDIVDAGVAAGKNIVCNAQIVDTSASYSFTADDLTQQDFVWASWMLCVDAARTKVAFRAFDSSSDGVRRVRTRPAWRYNTGNPTGARTFDTSSGTTPSGIWYREFEHGTIYLNITSTSKSSSISGVGTLAARTALWVARATTLTDDFNDNDFNTSMWVRDDLGTATIAEQNGRWECALIASDAGVHYGVNQSLATTYDFTGMRVEVQLVQAITSGTSAELGILAIIDSDTERLEWYYDATTNEILARKEVANTFTTVFSATYSAATHAYFAIREQAGTTYWETSTDGNTWTIRHSESNPITLTSGYVAVYAGTFESVASPGTAIWDNLAVADATAIVANHLGPGTTLHQPSVTGGAAAIAANHLAAATTLHQPSVTRGAVTISANHLAAGTVLHQPSAVGGSVTIAANHLAAGTLLYQPGVGIVTGAAPGVLLRAARRGPVALRAAAGSSGLRGERRGRIELEARS